MSNTVRETVLSFVRNARANPASASAVDELRALERAAQDTTDEGFVALTAPKSPWTWEVRTTLPSNSTGGSNRVPFQFPYAVNVVGLRPSVVAVKPLAAGAGQVIPTLEDIDVLLDVNNTARLTGNDGATTGGGAGANGFVTLGSIGIQTPRILGLEVEGDARPELGFTFRWKQAPPAAAPFFYESAIVAVAIYAYPVGRGLGNQTSLGVRGT